MQAPQLTRVGPYQILSVIGQGGMGQVYRARDERLARDVAVKVLHAAATVEPQRQRRFLQEARAAGALQHPNIVAVYDVGIDDGVVYIVSELVDGASLRAELERGPVALDRALHLAAQIADGLNAAHQAGFVHRDLKPDNVMITHTGRVKIVDFGLAKAVAVDSSDTVTETTLTAPHVVLGTASYMSPEQARGAPVDFRSDLFAFGALLFELVTGQRAFHRPTVVETLSAVLNDTPPSVDQLNPSCPAALRRIVERCLSKLPEDRYAATADLHHDLIVVRDEQGRYARSGNTRRGRLLRRLVVAAIALALVAAGVALSPFLLTSAGADLASYRILPFATESGYEGQPAWSPDGRSIAYVAEVGGVLQVHTRNSDTSAPVAEGARATQLTRQIVDCQYPFWSADSSRIYFISRAREADALWSVSAAGGAADVVLENVKQAVIAPDGSFVFMREEDSTIWQRYTLWRQAPDGTAPQRFASDWSGGGVLGIGFLSMAPDGSKVALWASPARRTRPDAGFDDAQVWIFDYPSGRSRRVLSSLRVARAYPMTWMPDSRHVIFGADFVADAPGARLWRADTETGRLEALTATPARDYDPAMAPDGRSIAFTSDSSHYDVIEIPVDGGAPVVHLGSARDESEPVWMPGARQFVYVTDRSGTPEVWLADPAQPLFMMPVVRGTQFRQSKTYLISRLAVAPAADRLVYQRRDEDGYYLWMSILGGRAAERLVTTAGFVYQDSPTWSPDGRVAFTFAKGARLGLASVRPGAREDPRVLLPNLSADCDPHWSPDGRWITCRQLDGLHLISPDGQATDGQSTTRLISGEFVVAHDWAPDSSKIYALRETDDLTLQVVSIDVPSGVVTLVAADIGRSPPTAVAVRGFSVASDGRSILTARLRLQADIHLLEGARPTGPAWSWRRSP